MAFGQTSDRVCAPMGPTSVRKGGVPFFVIVTAGGRGGRAPRPAPLLAPGQPRPCQDRSNCARLWRSSCATMLPAQPSRMLRAERKHSLITEVFGSGAVSCASTDFRSALSCCFGPGCSLSWSRAFRTPETNDCRAVRSIVEVMDCVDWEVPCWICDPVTGPWKMT